MEASDRPQAPDSVTVATAQASDSGPPVNATSPAQPHRPQLRYSFRGGPRRPFHSHHRPHFQAEQGGFRGSFRANHSHGHSHYGPSATGPAGGPGGPGGSRPHGGPPPGVGSMPMLSRGAPRGLRPPQMMMQMPMPVPVPQVPVSVPMPLAVAPMQGAMMPPMHPPRMQPMQMAPMGQIGMMMPPRQPMMMPMQQQQQQQQQQQLPVALPAGWSEHFAPDTGYKYYYNATTGVSTYEPPTASSMMALNGVVAVENGASQSQNQSVQSSWMEYQDDASGKPYYYNTVTKACVWDMPEEFRVQQARAQVEKLQEEAKAKEIEAAGLMSSASGDDAHASSSPARRSSPAKSRKQQEEEALEATFKSLSRAERMQMFKDLLKDKCISPQLKWNDAQKVFAKDGLLHDVRWKVLCTNGERKQCFAEYCTQVINQEAVERRRQVKKQREEFSALLAEFQQLIHARTSFQELEQAMQFVGLRNDPRFVQLKESPKDQEELFLQFQSAQARDKERVQQELRQLLQEQVQELLHRHRNELAIRGSGKRLDSSLKKTFWKLVESPETDATFQQQIQQESKHVVYDWLEDFVQRWRAQEALARQNEREQAKEEQVKWSKWLEATFDSCFGVASHQQIQVELMRKLELLRNDQQDLNKSTTPCQHHQQVHDFLNQWNQLDEKKQRRLYEKWVHKSMQELKKPRQLLRVLLPKDFDVLLVPDFDHFVQLLRDQVKKLKVNVEEWLRFQHEQMALSNLFTELDDALSHFANARTFGGGENQDPQQQQPEQQPEQEEGEQEEGEEEGNGDRRELPLFVKQVFELLQWRAKKHQEKHHHHHKRRRVSSSSMDFSKHESEHQGPDHGRTQGTEDQDDHTHNRPSSSKRRRRHSASRSRSRSRSHSRSPSRSRSRSKSKSRSRSRSRSMLRKSQEVTLPNDPIAPQPSNAAATATVNATASATATTASVPVSVPVPVPAAPSSFVFVPRGVNHDDDDELEEGEVEEE